MKTKDIHSRRKFIGSLTTGAMAASLAFIPESLRASVETKAFDFDLNTLNNNGANLDFVLKNQGKKAHSVAYDMSSVNPWGLIWSNVYYITNQETGTSESQLGVTNIFRHHGMIFGLNDETIKKYKLGEFFGFNDPITGKPAVRNPYYTPEDGVFPLPGLAGIKALQEKGTTFCICDMARKVYAQFVSQKVGAKMEDVYNDFVKGTLPGIHPAPSGVWALGRLAENKIAYIDASVG